MHRILLTLHNAIHRTFIRTMVQTRNRGCLSDAHRLVRCTVGRLSHDTAPRGNSASVNPIQIAPCCIQSAPRERGLSVGVYQWCVCGVHVLTSYTLVCIQWFECVDRCTTVILEDALSLALSLSRLSLSRALSLARSLSCMHREPVLLRAILLYADVHALSWWCRQVRSH